MAKNVDEDTFEEFLDLLCHDGKFADVNKNRKVFIGTRWIKSSQREPTKEEINSGDSGNVSTVSNTSLHTEETGFCEDNNNIQELEA